MDLAQQIPSLRHQALPNALCRMFLNPLVVLHLHLGDRRLCHCVLCTPLRLLPGQCRLNYLQRTVRRELHPLYIMTRRIPRNGDD